MKYDNYIAWKNWRERDFGLVLPGSRFHFDQIFRRQLASKSTILEIGFGNGELLSYLKDLGHKVIGVEINDDLVNRANKLGYVAYGGAVWDISELQSEKFDLVVAFAVVEHMSYEDLVELFSWARDHLNEGGTLQLKFPEGASPFGLGYQNGDFTHLTCLTKSKVGVLCDASKMKLLSYTDERLVSNMLCSFGFIGRLGLLMLQWYGGLLKLMIRIVLFPICPSLQLGTNSVAVITIA